MPEAADDHPQGGPADHGQSLFGHLLKARYFAAVVVLVSILHSLTFLIMGTRIALRTYWHVLRGAPPEEGKVGPGVELLHSLDYLLVALVLMILALAVARLFLFARTASVPAWLDVDSFSDLKYLLWETILTALLIIGLSLLATGMNDRLTWSALIIPTAILLLSVSLYFMKRA
jgi:uncharacterized membrane protein YqhA